MPKDNYTAIKLFNSADMPEDVRSKVKSWYDGKGSYVPWYVDGSNWFQREITRWLIGNGAMDKEKVIIYCKEIED